MPRSSRYQRGQAANKVTAAQLKAALTGVARLFAPGLKVSTAVRAGGIEYRNHNRRALVAS